MKRRLERVAGGLIVGLVAALGVGCPSSVENDFDQVLALNGFFTDAQCGSGLAGVFLFTDGLAIEDEGGGGEEGGEEEEESTINCGLDQFCVIALQLENETTGVPIPGEGAVGAEGPPVPFNDGVRVQIKSVTVDYTLPRGTLPRRTRAISANVDPGDDFCFEFLLFEPQDTIQITQNPEDYPDLPFAMTTRVSVDGVTESGFDIRTQGDITVWVQSLFGVLPVD